MNASTHNPTIIWHISDGKPGHRHQSLGLIAALKRFTPCEAFEIPVLGRVQSALNYLSATWPQGRGLPLPDLIIGAGHGTHLHMLAAQKVYGGQTVLMMQPSLPTALFDLCLIPEHDHYHGNGAFIETRGVLNTMQSEGQHDPNQALIMVGGPSKHCTWEEDLLIAQIVKLTHDNPNIEYTLTTSRRTPNYFASSLEQRNITNLTIVPFHQTPQGWVAQQLAKSYSAWITEDSASMVYEALTAKTAVGILSMPTKRDNRVLRGVNQLIADRLVVRFDPATNTQAQLKPVLGFAEADRCADWILNRWEKAPASATLQPVWALNS